MDLETLDRETVNAMSTDKLWDLLREVREAIEEEGDPESEYNAMYAYIEGVIAGRRG